MTNPERLGLDSPRSIGEDVAEAYMMQNAGALALERLIEMQLVRTVAVPAPAAGAEWSTVVPAGVVWELLTGIALFATSAAVANRIPILQILDPDSNQLARFDPNTTQAASLSLRYVWSPGLGYTASPSARLTGLPSPFPPLPAGYKIGTLTGSLDVGDAYSLIFLVVREWSPSRLAQRMRYLLTDLDAAGGLV